MKKLIIGILIAIIASVSLYFLLSQPKNISEIDSSELAEYTLQQSEVARAIGNEEILSHQVAPTYATTNDTINNINQYKPSCLDKIKVGDLIRAVTYYTDDRDIIVAWSVENNEIACILSINK